MRRLSNLIHISAFCLVSATASPSAVGIFEGHGDIGAVLHPGSAEFEAASGAYALTGSGENMWFAKDEFQFVWKKLSGDVRLSAEVSLPGDGGDPHRKAILMIRQSLDPDSAYVDVVRHGDGLTSLQFREEKGAATHEIQSSMTGPSKLRIEKRGELFYMWVGSEGDQLHFAGGSMRVLLREPF